MAIVVAARGTFLRERLKKRRFLEQRDAEKLGNNKLNTSVT